MYFSLSSSLASNSCMNTPLLLQIPSEVRAKLSNECIDFLSCLLAGPESRIGSRADGGPEFENGQCCIFMIQLILVTIMTHRSIINHFRICSSSKAPLVRWL